MHISNHSMQVGDRGVVVVGASAELGDLAHMGSAGALSCPQPGFQRLADLTALSVVCCRRTVHSVILRHTCHKVIGCSPRPFMCYRVPSCLWPSGPSACICSELERSAALSMIRLQTALSVKC